MGIISFTVEYLIAVIQQLLSDVSAEFEECVLQDLHHCAQLSISEPVANKMFVEQLR